MSLRTEKVASLVREEVGILFTREFRDRTYGFITVTDVHMSPDLRIAKIYVSILGNDEVKERTLKMLENQKPHIRSLVGSHLRLKFTPSIQFYIDDTLDRVESINRLIKQIHDKDEGKQSS